MTRDIQRFVRGDAVRARGERWTVAHVTVYETAAVVELTGADVTNSGAARRLLLPFESIDAAATVDRLRVVRQRAWRRAARRALAEATPGWMSLRAAPRANTALLPYQLEPALAITSGLTCRLLLADAVGLGKTIQAGFVIAEILARERDARVLVVTPAGLREQWRDELRDRFALAAAIIDASALVRATAVLPDGVNPWAAPRVAIASIDFLKRADVIRSLEPLSWDLVAFDEAHALSGRSDRTRAAEIIAARARRVVIITATPHDGDDAAFERLRGLGCLDSDDPLLTFRRSRSDAGLPDGRTTRRLRVTLGAGESRLHRALAAYTGRVAAEAPGGSAARLAMIVLGRRASSSPASLARSIERRLALLGGSAAPAEAQIRLPLDDEAIGEDEEPIAELAAPGLPDASEERRWLERILGLARAVRTESKLRALARLLRRTREPAVVFTEYRDTLRHVLAVLGQPAAVLHGGLSAAERTREARRFTHGNARVLLATDAASEGLNLHHRCRLVVSLDVPWTPLRLEQRVGRVDRLGQARRVHAVLLLARGTPEERVAAALSGRAQRAERGAPFACDGGGAALVRRAPDESARLAVVRALARGDFPDRVRARRPVLARTARGPLGLTIAIRLLFADHHGAVVWEALVGFELRPVPPPVRTAAALRQCTEQALRDHAIRVAAASASAHASLLARLRHDLAASLGRLLARERAMLRLLHERHARMAAHLLQPGLFDHRSERHAEAQRRVLAEAAEDAAEHLRSLERLCDPQEGGRSLVFAILRAAR